MTFEQLLLILRSRWRLVATIMGCVLGLTIVLTMLMTKKYTAMAQVVIDSRNDPISAKGFTEDQLSSYVATQIQVIGSERVAARAIRSIKLDQDPELRKGWLKRTNGEGDMAVWLADQILENRVTIGSGKDKAKAGNVINIGVTWPDAKIAADLANAFAASAIETNIELKIQPAKQFAGWFDEHSRQLRESLRDKQRKLSEFESQSGIIATDDKLDVETARLAELSTQLVTVQGERSDSSSRARQSGETAEVLASPVIGKLKADLSDAEARQADIAGRLGKNHPDYQSAAGEVTNLRNRIAAETGRINNALGSTSQVNVRREADLRAALEGQKQKVLQMKHQHDEASLLQSDVTTAQRDLDAVTERYAQVNLESQAQQSTNMVQLTVAMQPFKPSSPKLILNLLAGIVLGAAFGMGGALMAERRDPRVRDTDELAALLGVPTLARIDSSRKAKGGDGKGPSQQVTRTGLSPI